MILIIEARTFPEVETYLIEVRRDQPLCPECESRPMEKLGVLLCRRRGGPLFQLEMWRCSYCRTEESFMPGFYGDDDVEMTPAEYADYAAGQRQKEKLLARFGTRKPISIRDYWL